MLWMILPIFASSINLLIFLNYQKHMKKQFWYFILLFLYVVSFPVQGKVTLPSIFSDNMVLQQKTQVNIWGKAVRVNR